MRLYGTSRQYSDILNRLVGEVKGRRELRALDDDCEICSGFGKKDFKKEKIRLWTSIISLDLYLIHP